MTIQQIERAREILARHVDWGRAVPGDNVVFRSQAEAAIAEALTPQTSEEVVEAVARAICTTDATRHCGLEDEFGWKDPETLQRHVEQAWKSFLPEARAAIAAMPSIPQESDAEVTEEMLSAGRKYLLGFGIDDMDDSEVAGIYTAMTSARDRRG